MIIIDINEYLKLINICNPKVVFKGYKERGMGYPYNEYFLFFDNNGIGYKINGNGYKNLYDMYDGCPKGFPDGKTYYKAMAGEFVDYNEYKKITEMGYNSKNDYLEAIELGFEGSFEKIKKYLHSEYDSFFFHQHNVNIIIFMTMMGKHTLNQIVMYIIMLRKRDLRISKSSKMLFQKDF